MATDKEFDALMNKYHTAIAKAQDLQEQLSTKQKQWAKREKDFRITEKITRELCEDILAKDRKEMVLGTDYSWSEIPLNELINKSKRTFKEYCEKRTDFMRKIMNVSEQRLQEVESLKEQISIMKLNPTKASISSEELQEQIAKDKRAEKVKESLPMKTREKAEEGKISVVIEDGDEINMEEAMLNNMADMNSLMQVTPKSIPVSRTKKQLDRKLERKQQKMMAHTINLKEYEEKMTKFEWTVLKVIGEQGVSRYSLIETAFLEALPKASKNRCRIATTNLGNIGLVSCEKVTNPLIGNFNAYQLSDMGSRVYTDKYSKTPVMSEMDMIMAEHDNCQHGYGIRIITEMLQEKGIFKDVCDTNRKNPITLSSGISYIPDIICTDNADVKMYIEYECANHTQKNFNAKCNKMSKVTSVLNFIAPNRTDLDKLCHQVEEWIKNRGATSLQHVTIRVTSAYQMKDVDLLSDGGWKVVYRPGKSQEAQVNF